MSASPGPIPIDARLLTTIIHNIRNPLNVIGLTLRVIEGLPAEQRADLDEDLGYLRDNAVQIEKMLSLVSDLCRLKEQAAPDPTAWINPGRFLGDILDERASKPGEKAYPALIEIDPTTPDRVEIDPSHLRGLVLSALMNAAGATDRPLSIRSTGSASTWTIEIAVDRPPPSVVSAMPSIPERYERLIGSTTERKGLDLAIASWLAGRLGGSVRFEVEPGRRSSILIDLPIKPA